MDTDDWFIYDKQLMRSCEAWHGLGSAA